MSDTMTVRRSERIIVETRINPRLVVRADLDPQMWDELKRRFGDGVERYLYEAAMGRV